MIFTPTHSELLFYPSSQHIAVHSMCLKDSVKFRAELGVFMEGFIKPALGEVTVTVSAKDDSAYRVSIETDAKGKYR